MKQVDHILPETPLYCFFCK